MWIHFLSKSLKIQGEADFTSGLTQPQQVANLQQEEETEQLFIKRHKKRVEKLPHSDNGWSEFSFSSKTKGFGVRPEINLSRIQSSNTFNCFFSWKSCWRFFMICCFWYLFIIFSRYPIWNITNININYITLQLNNG